MDDSAFSIAYGYYESGDIDNAFINFQIGAGEGDTSCMVWLGILYGDGFKEDIGNKNEIFWYKKAWVKGDSAAPNNLAIVYKNQSKYIEAENWFKIAIENGDGDANLELAKLYISLGKESLLISKYLTNTINSSYVAEQSIEEARVLITEYT